MKRARHAGFTLLEILVVMVVIGVLATLVSLSVSGRAVDDRMQAESRRLEELLRLASDEAQAKGVELGFRQTTEGFDFLTPDSSSGQWTVLQDGLFRPRQIADPFYLELRVDGRVVKPAAVAPREKADEEEEEQGAALDDRRKNADEDARLEPQLLILSSGELTAFTLDLRLRDKPLYYRIEGNALGELNSQRFEEKR
jgi:general secretion pathway protein H